MAETLAPLLSAAIRCRDAGRCVYCDRAIEDGVVLTVDHVLPRVWGGTDDPDNLVTACTLCNGLKGAMKGEQLAELLDQHRHTLPDSYAYLRSVTGKDVRGRLAAAKAKPLDWQAAIHALEAIKAQRKG